MTPPPSPAGDEVARWEHDLEHCTWLKVEQEPQAPETSQVGD